MKSVVRFLALGIAFTALPLFAAENAAAPPAVGTSAPDFHLQDQNGKWHTLDEYAGKWVVLYFYPKDGTPGCTKQVCKYRDEIAKVRAAGAEVLGVSVDDVSSHEKFAKEHNVPFPLLADSDKSTAKAYGVLTSKFGFTFARRDTFVIDPQGKVAKYYQDVDPEKNVEQVLQDLSTLKAPS
jgi:peroxiredoxin Q/BCP